MSSTAEWPTSRRSVGEPATDLLLEHVMRGAEGHMVDYETKLADGRRMRSSTVIIKDVADVSAAALCINTDISAWQAVHRIAAAMAGGTASTVESVPAPEAASADAAPGIAEAFVHDVDELASILIERSIDEIGCPVELMRKEHKMRVVERLRERGLFLLKDAVEMTAAALSVTRFTIYNYLNEIGGQNDGGRETATRSPRRKET